MDKKRRYYFLIPENLFDMLDVIDHKLSKEIKGYDPVNTCQIISILCCHLQKSNGKAPLKIEYLKKLVPQGDRYLKGLMDLEIVQRSGIVVKGLACYRYNFAPIYQTRFMSFPLNNPKLQRRIEAAMTSITKQSSKYTRGHSEQVRNLRSLTLSHEFFNYFGNGLCKDTTEQFNYIWGSAIRIMNKDITCSVDVTSGRFHSNITNMPKMLRKYLRINGEPLVNIDIKNSQPYLSTIILTNPSKVSWMTKDPVFSMLLQTLKVSDSEDVKRYIYLVASGKLYEYLRIEFYKEGLALSRDETKKQILRILFSRNRMPMDETNRLARQVFISRFPKVHRIFSKVRGSNRGDSFHSFKRFAILLQRMESFLILDIILKRIYKEIPGVIAITIHDSIMTGVLTNNVAAVSRIMIEELTRFVGFAPKIKIEWNPSKREEEEKKEPREEERKKEETRYIKQYDATALASLN